MNNRHKHLMLATTRSMLGEDIVRIRSERIEVNLNKQDLESELR